jgi:haloalkane dehalogenase
MRASGYDILPSRVVRSPDSRFESLPDFPYTPRYEYFYSLRYAFIDQTSGVYFNGRELSSAEIKDVPAGNIQWETYLCLQ